MGDLERVLSNEITSRAARSGNELVLRLTDARVAVLTANQNLIAVLGVEVLAILESDFGVESFSGYDLMFGGNWKDYVSRNNDAALRFLDENSYGEGYGYGYVLTSTSENEFRSLRA